MPEDATPESFDWSFVANLDVLVLHRRNVTSRDRLRDLLRSLLAANPTRLIVIDCERSKVWFIKSASRGVEVAL